MSSFPTGFGEVAARCTRSREIFSGALLQHAFVERIRCAFEAFAAHQTALRTLGCDKNGVFINSADLQKLKSTDVEVVGTGMHSPERSPPEQRPRGGADPVAPPLADVAALASSRDSLRAGLTSANESAQANQALGKALFIGSTIEKLQRLAPWLQFDDRGGGAGGDCSLMSVCDAFVSADGDENEEALVARRMRHVIIDACRNFKQTTATFPLLEAVYGVQRARQLSESIVQHFVAVELEKREARARTLAMKRARDKVNASMVRRSSSRLNPGTGGNVTYSAAQENLASTVKALAEQLYESPPVVSSQAAIDARVAELLKEAWFDHSEWVFVSALLKRRVWILQAVSTEFGLDYALLTKIPDGDCPQALLDSPACIVAFVSPDERSEPAHYIRVLAAAPVSTHECVGVADPELPDSPLLADSQPAAGIGVADRVSSRSPPGVVVSTPPASMLKPRGSPAFRPPILLPPADFVSGSGVDVEECVLRVGRVRSISFYKFSQTASRIVYKCQFDHAYQLKTARDVSRGTSVCEGKLVFVVSSQSRGFFSLCEESSVLRHTCPASIPIVKITSDVVTSKLLAGPSIPARNADVQRLFPPGTVSDSMASRCRRDAILKKYGTVEDNFASLEGLLERIRSADHSFVYDVQCVEGIDGQRTFQRLYVEFAYARHVISSGLPFLSIDGCHSRHSLGGVFYLAVTLTPSFQVLPVALAYEGREENAGGWQYFCERLRATAAAVDGPEGVVMSDRRAGIGAVLNATFPYADKVACSRHIGNNAKVVSGLSKPSVDGYVNRLAKATNAAEYEDIEHRMLNDGSLPHAKVQMLLQYLRHPNQWNEDWALHASANAACRYGIVTSNASECLNAALREARAMPICAAVWHIISYAHERYSSIGRDFWKMLQGAYPELSQRNFDLYAAEIAPGPLMELVVKAEEANRSFPLSLTLLFESELKCSWKVVREDENARGGGGGGGNLQRVVQFDRGAFKCTCNVPRLYGIPCRHVLCVISEVHDIAEERRPRWRYSDAILPRLSLQRAKAVLAYDISDVLCIDNHGIARRSLLPHAHVADRRGRKRNRNGSRRSNDGGEQRIHSGGETSKRPKRYRCSACGAAGHTRPKCVLVQGDSNAEDFDGDGETDEESEDGDEGSE